jgi:predicted XRE-type DNA-binding protein
MIEKTRRRGARLSIVLAGHPRLKNDLRRPSQEETGARAVVFEFEGIQGHQRRFISWLMEQCAPDVAPSDILAPDALDLLVERLVTPLQIQHYLSRMLEQAYRFGEKPVTTMVVNTTLAPDMHALEPMLTRHGYNVKALSELLHIRQPEVRSFLRGQLSAGRTEELHNQLLTAGIPVNDGSSSPNPNAING